MSSPVWIIADPCIRRTAGHYAAYAAACRDGLEGLGLTTRCWAHRDVPPALRDALHAEPVFTYDCWHQFSTMPKLRFFMDPPRAARSFLHDVHIAADRSERDAIVFAPTVDHRQLLAWAWWARRNDAPRRAVVTLRYSYADPAGAGWVRAAAWVRLAFRVLRRVPGTRIRFATDSERLADEYVALGAPRPTVLPIPHTTVVRRARTSTPATIRAVLLGDARTEKGFAVLADAVARLRAEGRAANVEFALQANIESPVYASLEEPRARLRALPGVTLHERALTSAEYDALLASADLVLLPYDQGVYRARTSGPFAEAVAAGIPVVCTADTWMSDQLSTFGAGTVCGSGDAASLASAIERAAQDVASLTARAESRRDAWVAFHSPANLARTLVGMVA